MTTALRELDQLLAGEIERWLRLVRRDDAPHTELRAALHSLKGSAGLAGYSELTLVMGQLGTRLREKDPEARAQLLEVLEHARERLRRGETPLTTAWPEPPLGLTEAVLDPRDRAEYWAAMRDRLGEIDGVLASRESAVKGLERAQRTVHAMKGSASAVGDDVTTWYCHGLESRLKSALRTEPSARDVLVELGRHRALLALLIEDSHRGLAALEALAQAETQRRRAPPERPSPRRSASEPAKRSVTPSPGELQAETGFHLRESALDGLLERLDRVELVHGELGQASLVSRRLSARLREVRAQVTDALRALGPARPWGPPAAALGHLESAAAALRSLVGSSERGAASFRSNADFLRGHADEMRSELLSLRRTRIGAVLERVAHAAMRLAETESKLLRVEIAGGDYTIDRRIAERLYDALVQLARNAVAHGIARPQERGAAGKRPEGLLCLRAERRAEWLRVTVEDDGQGADVERIRALAVQRGALSYASAATATEAQLLALLFLAGFTTRDAPDLLAGRGLGLQLVQESARSLGGIARLARREGGGIEAILEVPAERALIEVLWVEDGEFELALPVAYTRGVVRAGPGRPAPRLSTCLGEAARSAAQLEIKLAVYGVESVAIGIDRALGIEEVTVRPIPALIAAKGPFSGAVLRADGSLRLALDVPVLAARAWAAA